MKRMSSAQVKFSLLALVLLVKCAIALQASGASDEEVKTEDMFPKPADVVNAEGILLCLPAGFDAWLAAGGGFFKVDDELHTKMVRMAGDCPMAEFLDEKLAASEKLVDPESLAALKDFIDQGFLDVYEEFIEEQTGTSFKFTMGPPEDRLLMFLHSESPFQMKLLIKYNEQLSQLKNEYDRNPQKVTKNDVLRAMGEVTRKTLSAPCERYIEALDSRTSFESTSFFRELAGAIEKFVINEDAFFKRQSPALRLAVFRYHICQGGGYDKALEEGSLDEVVVEQAGLLTKEHLYKKWEENEARTD